MARRRLIYRESPIYNRKKGYEAGDNFIKQTINYLKEKFNEVRASYKIYRIGGDEFLIISQPYDYIDINLLKNKNFEITYGKWDNKISFKDLIKKLDLEIIENKTKHKKIKMCRDCILKKCPELISKLKEIENQK